MEQWTGTDRCVHRGRHLNMHSVFNVPFVKIWKAASDVCFSMWCLRTNLKKILFNQIDFFVFNLCFFWDARDEWYLSAWYWGIYSICYSSYQWNSTWWIETVLLIHVTFRDFTTSVAVWAMKVKLSTTRESETVPSEHRLHSIGAITLFDLHFNSNYMWISLNTNTWNYQLCFWNRPQQEGFIHLFLPIGDEKKRIISSCPSKWANAAKLRSVVSQLEPKMIIQTFIERRLHLSQQVNLWTVYKRWRTLLRGCWPGAAGRLT